jgi:FkbM family methyltransferase
MSISKAKESLLTSAYFAARRSGFLKTSIGKKLFVGSYFFYKRHIEDDLRFLIGRNRSLLHGGNVLDIGANIGYTAALLAQGLDADRVVYAFEPEDFNFELLQQTAAGVSSGKICPIQAAVGAQDGTVDLWLNEHHHADHRVITEEFRCTGKQQRSVRTRLVSIDQFLRAHPGPVSFIKIDVQGYEFAVCQGMEETLNANPDVRLTLEYAPQAMWELGFDPATLIEWLTKRDFKIWWITRGGRLSPGLPQIAPSGYADLFFSRGLTPVPPDG